MSSVVSRSSVEPIDDIERLRCPGEQLALALCTMTSVGVIGIAVLIVFAGTQWLSWHPVLGNHIDAIRAVLIAGVVALPSAMIGRNVGFDAARAGGVLVGPQQFPELHARLVAASHKLGLAEVPELYLSRDVEHVVAIARTVWGRPPIVVLNAEFIDEDWAEGLDWLTFAVARELGAIRLGHTRWWVELLTVYAKGVPGARTPLLVHWARSRDRCAAYVVPEGVRGLVVEAVGNHALPSVDIGAFVDQTERRPGPFDRIANVQRRKPSIVARARALYAEGFFDRSRDRERHLTRGEG